MKRFITVKNIRLSCEQAKNMGQEELKVEVLNQFLNSISDCVDEDTFTLEEILSVVIDDAIEIAKLDEREGE